MGAPRTPPPHTHTHTPFPSCLRGHAAVADKVIGADRLARKYPVYGVQAKTARKRKDRSIRMRRRVSAHREPSPRLRVGAGASASTDAERAGRSGGGVNWLGDLLRARQLQADHRLADFALRGHNSDRGEGKGGRGERDERRVAGTLPLFSGAYALPACSESVTSLPRASLPRRRTCPSPPGRRSARSRWYSLALISTSGLLRPSCLYR